MLPVALKSGEIVKQQGEDISLLRSTSFISTKTNVRSGRWYYESTHISGNQWHLIWFVTNTGGIYFYPIGEISSPRIFIEGSFVNSSVFGYVPFSITPVHTIGVGIDIEKHRFHVFYNHNFFSIVFHSQKSFEGFNARVWGAGSDDANETINVNFGDFSLQY